MRSLDFGMRMSNDMNTPLVFNRDGIRQVDRLAIEVHGMTGLVLMENAAAGASRLVAEYLQGRRVVIACGSGNNGGDGYAMARHLHNTGLDVSILAVSPPRPGSDAEQNARIAETMQLPIEQDPDVLNHADLIVDALLGTGLDRPVSDALRQCIELINGNSAVTLAVDIPSGLDADTGQPLGCAIRADATMTFVGWKSGFLQDAAKAYTGVIHVVDIGVPASLATSLCLQKP